LPRPRSSRKIRCDPTHSYFKPRGIPLQDIAGEVDITLEELEAMRLYDLEGEPQTIVGEKMGISQSSVSRHLDKAHKKIAKALVLGLAIKISNPFDFFHCDECGHTWRKESGQCENCQSTKFHSHIHSSSTD
jgi:predicted DNA-binding protein (UPF0251 family)